MDRKLAGLKLKKPLEEQIADLRKTYESVREDKLPEVWRSPEGKVNIHTIYIGIGRALIDLHIDDRYERMSDLVEDFGQLGWGVAYLVDTYHDRGLSDEEPTWLGYPGLLYAQTGKMTFQPSELLKSKSVMRECSEAELVKLFNVYLAGKCTYFVAKMAYGPSVENWMCVPDL